MSRPVSLSTARGDILYIHGRTGDYLEPATGQPRMNILDMAREGLRVDLAAALRQAALQEAPVVHEGVRVRANGHFISVRLSVAKLSDPAAIRGLLLVAFQTQPSREPAPPARKPAGRPAKAPPSRVQELEHELLYVKETLQSTVEELETSNEEFKSTNEELQSTNEELQSANEELETSKEEMQSLNEELQTVNAQLQAKVDDLDRTSDDMLNLLNSTAVATVFLDQELRIKRYTPEATKLVKPHPFGHRPAHRRPGAQSALRGTPGRCRRGAAHPGLQGKGGADPGRRMAPGAHRALPHDGQRH